MLDPDSGCGGKFLERWYFNTHTQECHMFLYGGSAGNENNFLTEADCLDTCVT